MLEEDPGYQGDAEAQVEDPLVRDGQDDKNGRKRQKYNHQSMKIVVVRCQAMCKWHEQR